MYIVVFMFYLQKKIRLCVFVRIVLNLLPSMVKIAASSCPQNFHHQNSRFCIFSVCIFIYNDSKIYFDKHMCI